MLARLAAGSLTLAELQTAIYFTFRNACVDGQLGMAQWLWGLRDPVIGVGLTLADVRSENNYAFRLACANGHLAVTQWLWELREFTGGHLTLADVQCLDNDAFQLACENGHLTVAQWLLAIGGVNELKLAISNIFGPTCEAGQLNVAQWLWHTLQALCGGATLEMVDGIFTFATVCGNGHLEVARWMLSLGRIDTEDAFYQACTGGFLEIAQWLLESANPSLKTISYIFSDVCVAGRLETAQWLWELLEVDGALQSAAIIRAKERVAAFRAELRAEVRAEVRAELEAELEATLGNQEVMLWLSSLQRTFVAVAPQPGDKCAICLEDSPVDPAAVFGHDTRHWSCCACLALWVRGHATCPICRQAI